MSFKRTATAVGALVALSCAGARAQETLELPTVTVEGSGNTGFFGEGIAQSAGSAMKMDTPIMETARSVSVVTQQQMQDRGVTTVSEALRYMPGVISSQYGVDNRADWGVIRGFDATSYQDGLQTRFGYYNIPRPETFLLDTVTVLKGPAGVLYGAGSVGVSSISPRSCPIPPRRTSSSSRSGRMRCSRRASTTTARSTTRANGSIGWSASGGAPMDR